MSNQLADLRAAAAGCQACDLWRDATQTVFGEGPVPAGMMLVGEQPGDQEDKQGRPFVGPAGRVLDQALAEAGIGREQVYLSNAVKHFKWKPRGKRRIHDKPNRTEVAACSPWLSAELELVQPDVLVVLGATAAGALLGPDFRVSRERGQPLDDTKLAAHVVATVHPSSLLRITDAAERRAAQREFVHDLTVAARFCSSALAASANPDTAADQRPASSAARA